jgi:hypothetical protein
VKKTECFVGTGFGARKLVFVHLIFYFNIFSFSLKKAFVNIVMSVRLCACISAAPTERISKKFCNFVYSSEKVSFLDS